MVTWRSGPESDQRRPSRSALPAVTNRPKQETAPKEDTTSIPIPGTPFRLTAEGRLHVAVDLQELLTNQGIPEPPCQPAHCTEGPGSRRQGLAQRALSSKPGQTSERSRLHPGGHRRRIRVVAPSRQPAGNPPPRTRRSTSRSWRRNSDKHMRPASKPTNKRPSPMFSSDLIPENSTAYLKQALRLLPSPIVKRNPTLSNPFVRIKVYELACGEP